MRLRRLLLRIFGYTVLATLSLLLATAATIKAQQHLLRHRATQLLADYETLHLGKTNWLDMQQFMQRWQHWGYASQPCDANYCSFTISIYDTISMHVPVYSQGGWQSDALQGTVPLLSALGFRSEGISVRLVVINGMLLSDQASILVMTDGDAISASTRSQPNLARAKNDYSYQMQMAQHPDYFVGRPSGCEGCMSAWVDFTPNITDEAHAELTRFQLDCFTRIKQCERPRDLLPALAPYHLYEEDEQKGIAAGTSPVCDVSPETRGRDAEWVIVVDALSKRAAKLSQEDVQGYSDSEYVTTSRLEVLKGVLPPQMGPIEKIMPYPGRRDRIINLAPEHMQPGSRYILIWSGEMITDHPDIIGLEPCGVIPDTPHNRAAVLSGIAQDTKFQSPKLDPYLSMF